jgi:hypothetical protein
MRGTPPTRRPILPPWSGAECSECAAPVEYVTLDVEHADGGERVAVVRAENPRGTIAARMIGTKLHGYRLTGFRPLRPGFVAMRLHAEVCEFATPPTEQHPLF